MDISPHFDVRFRLRGQGFIPARCSFKDGIGVRVPALDLPFKNLVKGNQGHCQN